MLFDVILYVHPLKNVNEKFEHTQVYWKVFYVKSVVLLKILKHHVAVFPGFSKNAKADFSMSTQPKFSLMNILLCYMTGENPVS